MGPLVFYITGHGFGHASRDVEIINALGRRDQPIVIRSAVDPRLLARTLRVPYELQAGPCDTGVVQVSSIQNDDAATVAAARQFYAQAPAWIDAEVGRLGSSPVAGIVADIPPLAFEVAARLGVPGIALGNFTWDWIYQTHPGFLPDGAETIERIQDAYRRATLALRLPFSGGFEIFRKVRPLPLVARRATQSREMTRRQLGWPTDRPIALASFGGYGLPSLDLDRLDCGATWLIVTTDRVSPGGRTPPPFVRYLSEEQLSIGGVRYENIVAAVDAVVTKPGYGILSECISTGTPMLYTSRGAFREYDLLVSEMPRVVRCRFIAPADLLAGRWRDALDALVSQPPPPETMAVNGAEVAAGLIVECLTA
jgi:L-arabinokinase